MTTEFAELEQELSREVTSFVKKLNIEKFRPTKPKRISYDEFLSDKMLLIATIRAGIPYSLFELIQASTPFTESDWAGFLNISLKSLHRYKHAAKPFKPIHSEKILEIAEVIHLGLEVFADIEPLNLWLQTPNQALGGAKPIELLRHSFGKELVLGELTRIEHGILG